MAQSTLDLLDLDDAESDDIREYERKIEERDHVDRSAVADEPQRHPQRSSRELFVIRGETTGTSRSMRVLSKKKRPASATSTRTRTDKHDEGNQSTHAIKEAAASNRIKQENEILSLRDDLAQTQRELAHTREERDEVQVAFRRLDQEITNGYNLTERKEKEMKIAELITKNQKLSQMLEKELKTQAALRASNADLQSHVQQLQKQVTLMQQVLTSTETKYAALVEANGQLMTNHAAAQQRLAGVQEELIQIQTNTSESASGRTQQWTQYEEKIHVWERKYGEMQRRLEEKDQLLDGEKDRVKALEQVIEQFHEEKETLENEVAEAHDRVIKMSGALKAMEVKVEATAPKTNVAGSMEKIYKQRIRSLEEELLSVNRIVSTLKETINTMLLGRGSAAQEHAKGIKRRSVGSTSSGRGDSVGSTVVSLMQKLRTAEETRDHKSRCLHVLMSALPTLLQQLDALQDKFHAAVESNTILTYAVDQLQSPDQPSESHQETPIALAREKYLLSGPYQPDLLMGYTASKAFSEVTSLPPRKRAKHLPFQVRTMTRSSYSQDSSSSSEKNNQLVLAADSDDASGASFLNRSKINSFLHFLQGKAGHGKCKQLLVEKIADLLSSHRDLMAQYSSEIGFYKVTLAKLEMEVQQLKRKVLAHAENSGPSTHRAHGASSRASSNSTLLLKLVETMVDNQRGQSDTFLTQAKNALALTSGRPSGTNFVVEAPLETVILDLAACNIGDDDLEPLLLKLSVSGLALGELNLRDNCISDLGAATLGAFLETCSSHFRVVNCQGNSSITSEGISRMRAGLLKNPRVHRVEMDSVNHTLVALGAGHNFETIGRPDIVLQVLLPGQSRHNHDDDQEESIQAMMAKLQSMGYCDSASNIKRAESTYRPSRTKMTSSVSGSTSAARRGSSRGSSSSRSNPLRSSTSASASGNTFTRITPRQIQRTARHRALEATLRRVVMDQTEPSPTTTGARGGGGGMTLTQMQYLLQNASQAAAASTTGASSKMASARLRKLQYAQSHLATIRGLGNK